MAFNSAFGIKSKTFLNISADNRVHLWDIDKRTERRSFTDRNSSSHTFTCFAWSADLKSSKKAELLAIGYSDGVIVVWDMVRGAESVTLSPNQDSGAPSDIVFALDNKSLFATSAQGPVLQYDISTGEILRTIHISKKKGAKKLAANPKADVIAAAGSSSVKIVDVNTEQKKKLESSLPGGVSLMKFSNCGKYLICCSGKSRDMLVFDVQADAPDTPIVVAEVHGMPHSFDVLSVVSASSKSNDSTNNNGNGKTNGFVGTAGSSADLVDLMELLVIHKEKDATFLRISKNRGADASEVSGSTRTAIVTQSCHILSGKTPIIGGYIGSFGHRGDFGAGNVVLAAGVATSPSFVQVTVAAPHGSSDKSYSKLHIFSAEQGNSIPNGGEQNGMGLRDEIGAGVTAPEILGPLEAGGKKRPVVGSANAFVSSVDTDDNSSSSGTGRKSVSFPEKGSLEASGAVSTVSSAVVSAAQAKTQQPSAGIMKANELTLAQRLESLSRGLVEMDSAATGSTSSTAFSAATSDSLVTILEQALQSGDDTLLEQCLACTDVDVVDSTTKRMPIGKIVPFLEKIVSKFEKRPSRGVLITRWISGIFRHHLSFLITLPDLSQRLAGLSQMLEQRLGSYSKMSSLAGRLDLLLAQVAYDGDEGTDTEDAAAGHASSSVGTGSSRGSSSSGNASSGSAVHNSDNSSRVSAKGGGGGKKSQQVGQKRKNSAAAAGISSSKKEQQAGKNNKRIKTSGKLEKIKPMQVFYED